MRGEGRRLCRLFRRIAARRTDFAAPEGGRGIALGVLGYILDCMVSGTPRLDGQKDRLVASGINVGQF